MFAAPPVDYLSVRKGTVFFQNQCQSFPGQKMETARDQDLRLKYLRLFGADAGLKFLL